MVIHKGSEEEKALCQAPEPPVGVGKETISLEVTDNTMRVTELMAVTQKYRVLCRREDKYLDGPFSLGRERNAKATPVPRYRSCTE